MAEEDKIEDNDNLQEQAGQDPAAEAEQALEENPGSEGGETE